jgi:HSF-type DNA-binding
MRKTLYGTQILEPRSSKLHILCNDTSSMESNIATANAEKVHAHGSSMVFPLRLYRLLHDVEEYHLCHVASFQPDGRSFRIHNRMEFTSATVTSKWFSFSKYESFQRQLHIYGFKRIVRGKDKGCYYHKDFIRGKYLLAQCIERIPIKKMMIPSSINATPVADVCGMTTGTTAMESPMVASTKSQYIQTDMINRQSGDVYSQQSTMAPNVVIQPNLLQGATPNGYSDEHVGGNNIIDQYLRDTLTNSISTLSANSLASSLSLLQTNIRGTNAPISYDTDVLRLSVLHRLQNIATQSVIDSCIPFSLPTTALASLPHQQTSTTSQSLQELLNGMTNHARLQLHELTNHPRSQSLSEMDFSTLIWHFVAHPASEPDRRQLSQSGTLFGTVPIRSHSSVHVAAARDTGSILQSDELNRSVLDEQSIRYVIMLLQQQVHPNYR